LVLWTPNVDKLAPIVETSALRCTDADPLWHH
jgi:hypothetical protein